MFYKHAQLKKDDIGEMHLCMHRFRKKGRLFFRRDEEAEWIQVPMDRFEEISEASSFLEAMAVVRR